MFMIWVENSEPMVDYAQWRILNKISWCGEAANWLVVSFDDSEHIEFVVFLETCMIRWTLSTKWLATIGGT
jgi:hypothetical protein